MRKESKQDLVRSAVLLILAGLIVLLLGTTKPIWSLSQRPSLWQSVIFPSKPAALAGRALIIAGVDGKSRRQLTTAGNLEAFIVSPDGKKLIAFYGPQQSLPFRLVDIASGRQKEIPAQSAEFPMPGWGSNSDQLVFAGKDGLYVYNLRMGTRKRIVQYPSVAVPGPYAVKNRVVFSAPTDSGFALYSIGVDGVGLKQLTGAQKVRPVLPFLSPDAKGAVFSLTFPFSGTRIGLVTSGNRKVKLLGKPRAESVAFGWSPDSEWVLWSSNQTGRFQVYISRRDGSKTINLSNSKGNDRFPAWSPDGKKIVFWSDRSEKGTIWVMDRDGSHQRLLTYASGWGDGAPVWVATP